MTSTAKTGGPSTATQAQDQALVLGMIAKLRAEQTASGTPAREAALLHEIGVLEEATGDEAAAARDQLAAVNHEPEFTEPLERLIAIIERRQSFKNLGKLLERLSQVALTSNERSRALIERAFFLADHQEDVGGARALAEEAVEAAPDDVTNFIVLELFAAKMGDQELRRRALERRAALSKSPAYRTFLYLDLAELRAAADDAEGAKSAIEEALAIESPARFTALGRAERALHELSEWKREAEVLETQAALLLASFAEPDVGDAAGVPSARRSPAHAADAWLRAAEAHRRAGDTQKATVLLDRALEQLPGDPSLTHARLAAADVAGDSAATAALAKSGLESGAKGELAAALWLRIAEAAASESNAEKALEAVRCAIAEDSQSIPARALELDLLGSRGDGTALAGALESLAERVTTERARAAFYLVAADAWARLARDAGGARAALSQAAACGAAPIAVARVGRMLAAIVEDQAWYEESTRRVIGQGAAAEEQASLWFEIARARALRGEQAPAAQAFESIAAAPGGSWLGHWLAAYALDLLPPGDGSAEPAPPSRAWETLIALAREEPLAPIARAERLVGALRALARSDQPAALELLDGLAKDDDSDPVVAVALAVLRVRDGKYEQAAGVLLGCASTLEDEKLCAALRLEAGLVLWRAGLKSQAVDAFERAAENSDAASGLLSWALRAAHPDDASARRRALDNGDEADASVLELERFTLELGNGATSDAVRQALAGGVDSTTGPGLAKSLARALFAGTSPDDRSAALDALAEKGPAAAAFARGAAFELELARASEGSPDPAALEAAAARWAESDSRAAPALEWLAAAVKHGDIAAEVSARRALAERIGGNAGAVVGANASLVAWLTGLEEPPPLASEHVAAALVNVELSPPGSDPKRRAAALTRAADALGEESLTVTRSLAGYNQLASGEPEAALATFRGVVEAAPGEIMGWEGLRAAAETLDRRDVLAEASAALGDAVSDPARGAELWEHAATILLDELGDKQRGEFALGRAVERDVRRFGPFDRLFRIVRERKENARLLDLIARRLDVADDPREIVKLFWERARVLRGTGDREGALAALENVRMLEPEHVGALALSGEIYLTVQRFAEAAEQLGRLSALAAAPAQQRLMSGIAAVDIYEGKLADPKQALAVLVGLHEAGLGTLPVRERMARAAAKTGAWQRAATTFEIVMNERDSSAGRAEAARLAMVIRRDRLSDPISTKGAVAKLLAESPADGEALDLVLAGVFEPAFSRPLLERGRDALQVALSDNPLDADGVERLSRIASGLRDSRLRQASLGALAALGVDPEGLDHELADLDRRVARIPSITIDEASLPDLADPEDGGPIASLMRVLGGTISEAIGPSLSALGVSKKERVDPRAGIPIRNEVVAWAGALGIGEIEVYVGGKNPRGVYGVATETPSLVVGPGVTAPLSPIARQAVARELFALQRGSTVLAHREPTDVAALVVAACKIAGVEIDVTPFAMLAEFQRQLQKEMPRRVRKLLPELAAAIAHSRQDPLLWYRAATSSLDRMAAIAAGDVSWVLAGDASNRGRPAASVEGQERARRLLSFVLSPAYLALREKLGDGRAMSDPKDGGSGSRPPRGPGAGASGSPGSIGKALGGDSDFEPYFSLDALTDEEARPTQRPPEPEPPKAEPPKAEPKKKESEPELLSADELDFLESDRPSFVDDEVTVVGPRDAFDGLGAFPPPMAPVPPKIPSQPIRSIESTAPTPLVQQPKAPPAAPSSVSRPLPAGLRPPPAVPRPLAAGGATSLKPQLSQGAPRPGPAPSSFQTRSVTPVGTPGPTPLVPPPGPTPLAPLPPPLSTTAPPPSPESSTPPDGEARTSLTPDEIAALDELEELEELRPSSLPPPKTDWQATQSDRPRGSSAPPRVEDRAALARPGQPDEWKIRAEWLEGEARHITDPQARSRALVVASELWAIAGNMERARRAAQDGNTAGRAAVAGRQLRWIAAAGGDWKTVASTLEIELRGASTQEARAHAALLDAEVHRLCLGDEEAARKKIDLAVRAQPDDPRVHLENIVEALTTASKEAAPLPEAPELGELSRALEQIVELRSGEPPKSGQNGLSAFAAARRALLRGDRFGAAKAVDDIGTIDGLKDAATWLSASLLAHDAGTREDAAAHLRGLIRGDDSRSARRALAARAMELGDTATLLTALQPNDGVFSPADQLTLALLTGADAEAIEGLSEAASNEGIAPLRAAALAAVGRTTPEAGAEANRAEAALGRALARVNHQASVVALGPSIDRFSDSHGDHPLAGLLGLEIAVANRDAGAVAEAAEKLPGREAAPELRDKALARGLLLELAGNAPAAREAYQAASDADPDFEAALRARLPALSPEAAGTALATIAEGATDPTHAALVLVEAVLRSGTNDSQKTDDWLKRAATLDPGLGIHFRIGEQDARSSADTERLIDWLRARREASNDDVERALDLVREALLSSDSNASAAAELLDTAIATHPGDVGLRELCERLRPGESTARGAWREAAADHAGVAARVLLLLQAAYEYERAGDRAAAARTARRASELGGGALAALTAQRTAAGTPEATRVSEELLARARATDDIALQRELYEELSAFDKSQGDSASALLWQSAILERSPDWLPALRHLEHAYTSASREEELEPIQAALARVLPDADGIGEARVAARARLKAGAWAERRELAELALARDPDCLWALRAIAAHARAADEPERALEVYQRLEELIVHPLDKAALNLRAAEAAARLGRLEDARGLLESSLESAPDHLVALTTLAEVLEGLRDFPAAARATEAVAEASSVDAHKVVTFHQAAVLWLDKVGDKERGRAALEQTIALDPNHEDAIIRLQNLLIAEGDHAALATLLERRIELAADGEERVALEVQRGRLLAGVGENQAARSALSAALDANPDHAGALEALADVCASEGDWSAAEQAWIRLARHVPEQERQAQIYRKLGELYDVNLPNPERAELAYLEVLKRAPDDIDTVQRLVQVYGLRGQVERAIELQTSLLERATTTEQKRDRTLALAVVFEQVAKDRKRADATLERARREWPQDVQVLRALVEHHRRAGEQRAAQVLLDRAASDARRALGTGRFDPALFEILGTVADLRGAADAALVAEATLAALAGQPFPVHGAGIAAADLSLDEHLAPEIVTPALRTLLRRTGDVLDAAYALDPRTLRAGALPPDASGRADQVRDMAKAFGIQGIDILVSPVLGPTCLAARSVPAQIVYGAALLEKGDDATRYFLLMRALKLVQARAATLARTVPIELGPIVAGFLSAISDYQPEGVDPKRLGDAKKRIKDAIIHPFDGDVPMLALEVIGSLGNRASQLATALSAWANRTALLAVGNPLTALRAIALSSGAELPTDQTERLRWIARNPEARDLFVFSMSDQYVEARKRVGVQG